jgi:hypothetical protein
VEGLGGPLRGLHQALPVHVLTQQGDDVPETVRHLGDDPLLLLGGLDDLSGALAGK